MNSPNTTDESEIIYLQQCLDEILAKYHRQSEADPSIPKGFHQELTTVITLIFRDAMGLDSRAHTNGQIFKRAFLKAVVRDQIAMAGIGAIAMVSLFILITDWWNNGAYAILLLMTLVFVLFAMTLNRSHQARSLLRKRSESAQAWVARIKQDDESP